MIRTKDQNLYELLNSFIEKCIINNNSILTSHENCFTSANIDDCISRFVDNYKDDKRNFEEKIKEQFDSATDEVRLIFAHANWLWAYSVNDMTAAGKERAVKICLPKNMELNNSFFPTKGFGSAGTYHKQNKYWEIVSITLSC